MCKEKAIARAACILDLMKGNSRIEEEKRMTLYAMWAISGTLVLLWLLGVSGAWLVGGWIHVLLVAAMLVMAFSLMSRPRTI
jgi:hypothetical protein